MLPPDTISIDDATAKAGVSKRTLLRWTEARLLPAPTVIPHPNGRGRVGVWPAWVQSRIEQVKGLQAQGLSLDAIGQALERDVADRYRKAAEQARDILGQWKVPGSSPVARRRKSETMVQWYRHCVKEQLETIGLAARLHRRIVDAASSDSNLEVVIALVLRGMAPVLMIEGLEAKRVHVVPDFAVGLLVSDVFRRHLNTLRVEVAKRHGWTPDDIRKGRTVMDHEPMTQHVVIELSDFVRETAKARLPQPVIMPGLYAWEWPRPDADLEIAWPHDDRLVVDLEMSTATPLVGDSFYVNPDLFGEASKTD
jgi:DNA-binding transcriptional MerR regulator